MLQRVIHFPILPIAILSLDATDKLSAQYPVRQYTVVKRRHPVCRILRELTPITNSLYDVDAFVSDVLVFSNEGYFRQVSMSMYEDFQVYQVWRRSIPQLLTLEVNEQADPKRTEVPAIGVDEWMHTPPTLLTPIYSI